MAIINIQGKLKQLLEPRQVGTRGWTVRDFVIETPETISGKGSQLRCLQAEGDMLSEITKIPHGAEILCEVELLGREVTNRERQIKYKNLDVVLKIRKV